MKLMVVILCLISIKSSLSIIERASYQRTGYFRRRQFPSILNQRLNPNFAKLILLKHLLQLDCFTNIYNRNPQSDRQKYYMKMGYGRMPWFTTKGSFSRIRSRILNDGTQAMYFLNPKIIMIPTLKKTSEEIANDLQREQEIHQNKNLPQHLEAPIVQGDEKQGSFQKENKKEDVYFSAMNVTKSSKVEDNMTYNFADINIPRIPLHPFSSSPGTINTAHAFAGLKSDRVQTYAVEEMIDSGIDVSKKTDQSSSEKEEENTSWVEHEKEIDESFKQILNEMVTPETTTPSFGHKVSTAGEKTPIVEITANNQFQLHGKLLPPPGKGLNNTEKNTLRTTPPVKSPNRGNVQLKMPDKAVKNFPNLKYSNKVHESFDLKLSSSTEHYDFANPDGWKKDKIEIKKLQTLSHPFFRLFNKGSPEIPRQKSKNLNLFPSSTTPNSLQKFFDKDSHSLLADNRKLITDKPLLSTVQPVSNRESTVPMQTNKTTLNLYIYPLITQNNSTLGPMNHLKGKSTTLAMSKGGSDPPSTTFRSIENESGVTRETTKGTSSALLTSSVKTDLIRDKEPIGKNGRKMHFNQDIKQEPIANDIVENSETKPRRSDILISENMKDYIDDEDQAYFQNYLEKVEPNNTVQTQDFSTNVNLDSYIRLIPEILNDIRGNRISNKHLSFLSNIFGKYWPSILEMSNNTELDILPLLKMKNENDLVRFLESYYSTDIKSLATEKINSRELYDYMEEYKDFYEEMLTEDIGGGKRKRYRRKRDDHQARGEYLRSPTDEKKSERIKYVAEYGTYDELLRNRNSLELPKPKHFN